MENAGPFLCLEVYGFPSVKGRGKEDVKFYFSK